MADTGYNAGVAFLAIRPSLRGFQSELRRELGRLDLSTDVRIRPDTSGLRREIDEAARAASRGLNVRIGANADALRAAIAEAERRLQDLQNSRTRPEIDADISAARQAIAEVRAQLANLDQQEATPQVVTDTALAQARIRELREQLDRLSNERADVEVDVDVAEAQAELERLRRALNDLDNRRIRAAIDRADIDGAHSSMLRLVTSSVQAASAVALIGSAVPAIAGLAAALASAAGAAGLIPAALGAGGAIFGTFKLGLSGISDAWEAVGNAEAASGAGAAAAAQKHAQAAAQVESATVSLQRAERALGEARKDAAREVAAAETAAAERVAQAQQQAAAAAQAVAAAQRAAREAAREVTLAVSAQEQAQTDLASRTRDLKYAQDALNGAWVEGKRALQDLQDQADGVALDQRQNVLDLKQARKDLLEAQTTGDGDKIARAQLAVDRLIEQQDVLAKRAERTNEANAKGQAAGVAGTEQVLAAKARIVTAEDEVGKAQERLAAQTYAVGQARERAALADQVAGEARARQALADKAIDAARVKGAADVALAKEMAGRRIRSAEESATDAARALAQAMQQTADQGTAAAQKLDAAMAKLSPNARSLIRELQRLKPAWDALQLNVQDRLLAGVSGRIGELAGKYLPKLRSMLGGIADGFNEAFHQTADFLGLKRTVDDLEAAFGRVKDAVKIFAGSVKPLVQIFSDLFIVGSEFLPGLAQGFKDAADRAADFVRNARDTGELKQWISDGIHQIQTFFGILGDVGAIAFTVFDAANDSGIGFLDTVKKVTGSVRDFLNSDEGQGTLHTFFDNLRDTVDNLKPGLLAILGAIKDAIKEIAPKMPAVAENFSKIASGVAPILKDIAVQVFDAFAAAFDLLADVPPEILVGLAGVLTGMVLAKKALNFARSFSGIFAAASSPLALAAILGLGAILASQAFKDALNANVQDIKDKPAEQRTTGEQLEKSSVNAVAAPFGGIPSLWDNYWEQWADFKKRWGLEGKTFGEGWDIFWGQIGGGIGDMWGGVTESYEKNWARLSTWWAGTSAGWQKGWDEFWGGLFGEGGTFSVDWQKLADWPGQKWVEFTTWWDTTSAGWGAGWNAFWQGIADWFGLKWQELKDWAILKWTELSNWWTAVSVAFQQAWNGLWQGIADWFSLKWEEIKQWAILKWTEFSNWWTAVSVKFQQGWNELWQGVSDWFGARWEDIKRIGSDAWNWLKANVWDPMVNFVTVDIPNAFQRAVDGIRAQWDRIRGIIGPPVEWMVNTVYNQGIRPVWNAIATKVGLPELPMAVYSGAFNPSGSTAGQSGTNTANRLATGGILPGYTPGRDVHSFVSPTGGRLELSGGEAVMRPEWTRAVGRRGVDAMNQVARRGGAGAVRDFLAYGGEKLQQFAAGGVVAGQNFARSQAGKPYVWGGVGPGGYDCSGFMSAITNVLLGTAAHVRRFATGSFGSNRGAGGFVPGTGSAFVIGVNPNTGSGVGHMAGTLGGMNVESRGGDGVVVGPGARGADNGLFPWRFFLPQAGGSFVSGGSGGGIGAMIPAWVTEGIAKANALLKGFTNPNGGTGWGEAIGAASSTLAKAAGQKMLDVLNPLNVVSGLLGGGAGPGSGPVVDQVRGVANRYGWGSGPQWDALSRLIQKESSWNPNAQNPTSTAYGLFQFLNSTWASVGGSKTSNPGQQAEYGLRYIKQRYSTPSGALAFHNSHNWYDEGGVASGRGIMLKQILEPERVLSPRQNIAFEQLVAHATSGYRGTSQRPIQRAEAWVGRNGSGQATLVGEYHSHLHGNATEARAVEELDHQLRKIRRRA